MQEYMDAGREMQDRRDAGKAREAGQEGCGTGMKLPRRDTGKME